MCAKKDIGTLKSYKRADIWGIQGEQATSDCHLRILLLAEKGG